MNLKLPLFITAAAATLAASACGPYFPPLYSKGGNPHNMPLDKDAAFKRFIKLHSDLLPKPFEFPVGVESIRAHEQDFADAIKKRLPEIPEYEQKKMVGRYLEYLDFRKKDTTFNGDKWPDFPKELDEFKLYLDGFDELHKNGELATVPEAWQQLLKLPAERRHYRTAWVHFILGNHFKADCHTHYDNCRNAVRAGFADTQGLALRSYTLEIRYGKNPVQVIRRAAEAELSDSPLRFIDTIDKHWIKKLSDSEYMAVLNDPLGREFLAIADPSPRFERMIGGFKLRNADVCAHYAYQAGKMDLARKYIAQLEKPTLLSVYLEAKIARHKGNRHLAVKKLRQWLEMAKNATKEESKALLGTTYVNAKEDVYGLLGNAMIMRHDFKEAAEYFYHANSEDDLYLVMERFFTLDEATAFADKLPEGIVRERSYHLIARRAFREKRFDVAEKYLPVEHRKTLKQYLEFIRQSEEKNLSGNEKAIALYNAAKILRFHGMELSGTQLAPDNFPGYYGIRRQKFNSCASDKSKEEKCSYNPALSEWTLCKEHFNGLYYTDENVFPGWNAPENHSTVPLAQRFHYRSKAAQLAYKAAQIAEDDDLRAVICCFGGNCLRSVSPHEADDFYKMLVNECKGSLLSKLADKKRWFPVDDPIIMKEIKHPAPLADLNAVKSIIKTMFPQAE